MHASLSALEKWYAAQCNGDWEHSFGVKIDTLDNPGWEVKIDLFDTKKHYANLEKVKIERTHDDWIFYWVENRQFNIDCGPSNLTEAIELFVRWFDS